MTAVLASCAEKGETSGGAQTSPETSENGKNEGAETGYVFTVRSAGGYAVAIDGNMADALEALGEPISYFEAASCAFEGLDKTYTYSGFIITTRPDGERDLVNSVLLTDDSAATPEGVYIGCSEEDVTAAYGEGERSENMISYTKGNSALNFILKDGKVISVEYLAA